MPKPGLMRDCMRFCMWLLLSLAAVHPAWADWQQGEYRIITAQYGTAERHVDVTAKLRELARRDERFRLGNDTFGVDPDRGRRKVLRIYTEGPDGRNRSFEYTEGSWVDGAQFSGWSGGDWGQGGWRGGWGGERPGYGNAYDKGGLQILRAEYGSDRRRIDITYRLQQRINQGRLSVKVDNDTAGDDPAERQDKKLWITYSVDGREMSRVVKEGRFLMLP